MSSDSEKELRALLGAQASYIEMYKAQLAEASQRIEALQADVERLKAERDEAREIAELLVEVRADAVGPPAPETRRIIACPTCGKACGNTVDAERGLTLSCQFCGYKAACKEMPDPPHVREDYREVWASGYRAGLAEASQRIEALQARCSQQEAKLMKLEGETVERWQRAEAAEAKVEALQGLLTAKYLNPDCAINGCQYLVARAEGRPSWQPRNEP